MTLIFLFSYFVLTQHFVTLYYFYIVIFVCFVANKEKKEESGCDSPVSVCSIALRGDCSTQRLFIIAINIAFC